MKHNCILFLILISLSMPASERFHNHKKIDKTTHRTNLGTLLVNALEQETPNLKWIKKIKDKGVNVNLALHRAILEGKTTAAIRLIDNHKANPSATNKKGQTMLMLALIKDNPSLASKLLERGAAIHVKDEVGQNALMIASQGNHYTIMKKLLNEHASLNDADQKGYTALMFASQRGSNDAVKCLLLSPHQSTTDQSKSHSLGLAAKNGHYGTVQLLLEHNANTDTFLPGGYTPLTLALNYKNWLFNRLKGFNRNKPKQIMKRSKKTSMQTLLEIDQSETDKMEKLYDQMQKELSNDEALQLLLLKADPNKATRRGTTPLQIAASTCHIAGVKLLLKTNATINPIDNVNPLLYTASTLPSKDSLSFFELFDNTEAAYAEIADLLLKAGVNIEAQNLQGDRALHLVSKAGFGAFVQVLIAHKALVNSTDQTGNTPLMHAASKGHCDVVRILLKNGALQNHTNSNNDTALICASKNKHYHTVKELLLNADQPIIDAVNKKGDTALTAAIKNKDDATVKLLLNSGANPTLKNKKNRNALDIAKTRGTKAIVSFLLQKMEASKVRPEKIDRTGCLKAPAPAPATTRTIQSPQINPIFEQIKTGSLAKVKRILSHPIDAFSFDLDNNTPLIAAIKQQTKKPSTQRYSIIEELLKNKDVCQGINVQDHKGKTPLLYAATNVKLTLSLLDAGSDPLLLDDWGNTVVSVFIQQADNITITNELNDLLQGIKNILNKSTHTSLLNQQNSNGETALMHAVKKGNITATMMLIKSGAQLTTTNINGFSARDIAQKIIEKYKNHNTPDQEKIALYQKILTLLNPVQLPLSDTFSLLPSLSTGMIKKTDKAGGPKEASLLQELQKGTRAKIKEVQNYSKQFSQQFTTGLTPLMIAIDHGVKTNILNYMLQNIRASHANLTSKTGETALFKEIKNGKRKHVINMLLTHGARVNPKDIALAKEELETVRLLKDTLTATKLEDIINILHARQDTVLELTQQLFQAAKNGDLALLGRVLAHNVDPNAQNSLGNTPLMVALKNGHERIAKNLMRNTDINTKNKDGQTALMICSGQGNYELVNLLLQKGADDTLEDNTKKTAYAYALQKNHNLVANRIAINRALQQLKTDGDIYHALHRHLDKYDTKIDNLIDRGIDTQLKPYRGYSQNRFTSFFPKKWESFDIFKAIKSTLASPHVITERLADITYQEGVIHNAFIVQGSYKGIRIEAIISHQRIKTHKQDKYTWKLITAYPLVTKES